MKARTRRVLRNAGKILVLFILGAFTVPPWLAGRAERAAERAWSRIGYGESELTARFRSSEVNGAALRVEDAAAALGIELRPYGVKRPYRRGLEWHPPAPMGLALESRLRGGAPDGTLEGWVDPLEPVVDALVQAVLAGEAPAWEAHWSVQHEAESANSLGHLKVTKLLVAHAVVQSSRGRPDCARDAIEASRRLAMGLSRDPYLVTAFSHGSAAGLRLAAVRLLPDADPEWVASLVPPEDAVFASAAAFDANLRHLMREPRAYETLVDDFPWYSRPRVRAVRHVVRWDGARVSLSRAEAVAALRGSDPCRRDPDELTLALERRAVLSEKLLWFPGCVFTLPSREMTMGERWLRAAWLPRLELAVTLRVLELRRLRAQGRLPSSGSVDVHAAGMPCDAMSIRHEVLPDGRFRAWLVGVPGWNEHVLDRMLTDWTEPTGGS